MPRWNVHNSWKNGEEKTRKNIQHTFLNYQHIDSSHHLFFFMTEPLIASIIFICGTEGAVVRPGVPLNRKTGEPP